MIQITIDNYWVSKLSYFSALSFAETLLSHDEIAFLVIFGEQNKSSVNPNSFFEKN